MPVLFFTAVCPLVAKIIDPHRRHITVTFKYVKPRNCDELYDEGDETEGDYGKQMPRGKCQDKCLDTPIPCNCCWKEKVSKVDVAGDENLIQPNP